MNIYHKRSLVTGLWSLVSGLRFVRHWLLGATIVSVMGIVPCLASGPHLATLIKRDGGKISGSVRYMASSKSYEIRKDKVASQIPVRNVVKVILKDQPAQLKPAIIAVQRGQYASAIAPLKKIKTDYEMFGPDVIAAQYLAKAYVNLNKPADAVRMCKEVLSSNPQAIDDPKFAGVYWDALLKDNKLAMLRRVLDEVIQKGSHEIVAVALVKRGDVYMAKGETKNALRDGYLRTILMFQDVKHIQPEALYKAIKAHQAIGQHPYAEKWRKRLLAGYPTSEYAKKIQ